MKIKLYILLVLSAIYSVSYAQIGRGTYLLDATDSLENRVVNTGFMSQKLSNLTGAYSFVGGDELTKTPSANFSHLLIGQLHGLLTYERGSELGRATVSKYNRGVSSINGQQPIVVVDGIVYGNLDYEYLTGYDIESVALLKDAAATSLYGIQGSNGVLLITTKSGVAGKLKVNVHYNHSFQQIMNSPQWLSSYDYASNRVQAWKNDGSIGDAPFTNNMLKKYKDGSDPYFPNNNYYDKFVKSFGNMDRIVLNVSGGNKSVTYFTSLGYMHQGSLFNTDPAQTKYDASPSMNWFTFRSKVDVNITDYISAFVNVFGKASTEQKASGEDNNYLYNKVFGMVPTIYGPTTLGDNFGGEVVTTQSESNPIYGLLNRGGYTKNNELSIVAHTGVNVDLRFLTKGLTLGGSISYHTTNDRIQGMTQDYERYVGSYDDYNMLLFNKQGSNLNTPLSAWVAGGMEYNISYYGNLNYSRTFGKHSVDVAAYTYFKQQSKRKPDQLDIPSGLLPYYRHSLGASAAYAYNDKYLIRADVGYSGSDAFSRANRYVATPAISIGWVISNESFLKGADLLSFLKLRTSYGISANDEFYTGEARYTYMDYVNPRGSIKMFANPDLRAETTRTINVGVDISFMKKLAISVDYFDKYSGDMLIDGSRINPSFSGIGQNVYPKINKGELQSRGFEVLATYLDRVGNDWSYSIWGSYIHSVSTMLKSGEVTFPTGDGQYAYSNREDGYSIGQSFGYLIDYSTNNGYISDRAALNKYTKMYESGGIGTPRMGDFMYRDLNGDNKIDERDLAPIGNGGLPRDYFALGFNVSYKNLTLSVDLQGAFNVWGGSGIMTETSGEGVFLDVHKYAWTEAKFRDGGDIRYPALSYKTSSTSMLGNDFNIVDKSYFRIKNVTLSYTLPQRWTRKIMSNAITVSTSGYNLFTFSKMPSKEMDPEVTSATYFRPFRVLNLGLNVAF